MEVELGRFSGGLLSRCSWVRAPLLPPIWSHRLTDRTRGFHPRNRGFNSPWDHHIALWSNGRILVSDARGVSSNLTGAAKCTPIAQMDEQRSSKPLDVGSSPTRSAKHGELAESGLRRQS